MAAPRVAVIDYGMGNLFSVASALRAVAPEQQVLITGDPELIRSADRVIFPGVGAIRDCMGEILRLGLDQAVREAVQRVPVLGICVGMQALNLHSEENHGVDCLGLLPGRVRFFGDPLVDAAGEKLKVPHMGWNQVHQSRPHPLWAGIPQDARFYFVHSYYVDMPERALVAGETEYGLRFASALGRDNLFAVQFHPEKSHTAGLQLLQNFLKWDGAA